jgi:hypothetical protein
LKATRWLLPQVCLKPQVAIAWWRSAETLAVQVAIYESRRWQPPQVAIC